MDDEPDANLGRIREQYILVRRRSCLTILVEILFVTAVIGFIGYRERDSLLAAIGEALVVSRPALHSDAIIVLGGGTSERQLYAAELYRQGLAPIVLATGAPPGDTPRMTTLHAAGVPDTAILMANGTHNTRDDSVQSLHFAERLHWHRIILVTDPFHMRRSLWTFDTAFRGSGIAIDPRPAPTPWFHADRWWRDENSFVAVDEEYLKLLFYVAHGYISL